MTDVITMFGTWIRNYRMEEEGLITFLRKEEVTESEEDRNMEWLSIIRINTWR